MIGMEFIAIVLAVEPAAGSDEGLAKAPVEHTIRECTGEAPESAAPPFFLRRFIAPDGVDKKDDVEDRPRRPSFLGYV